MDQLCLNLGLAPYLEFCITAADAGVEKPDPAIFTAALERVSVKPCEAIHVGDQPRSDAVGARAVGIHPVLLDRGGWQDNVKDCVRISNLAELDGLLTGAPNSLKPDLSERTAMPYYSGGAGRRVAIKFGNRLLPATLPVNSQQSRICKSPQLTSTYPKAGGKL